MQPSEAATPRGARLVAWGGTALFLASLGYFFFSYAARFGRPAPAAGGVNVAVNVALFTLFALHHSVFARPRVRAAVARAVPRPLERAAYVWVASALFIAVCALWQPIAGMAWDVTGRLRWVLLGVQASGLLLVAASAAVIDVLELSGVRQVAPRARATEFRASGPYAWMRHPIYAGWMLIVFFAPTMTMTRLVFALVSSLYLLVAIPLEERSLATTSAGAYERYARAVRWRLIPGLY